VTQQFDFILVGYLYTCIQKPVYLKETNKKMKFDLTNYRGKPLQFFFVVV
jgi:hypothetical protein